MADSSSTPGEKPLSYDAGEIHVEGAFTAEIRIAARVSLQDVWKNQSMASQIMGQRPGMYLKYLPSRYDEVTGDMLTGGSYLFRTLQDAKDFRNWTSNEFLLGEPKTNFWDQPLFEKAVHWSWSVIGAFNFTPVDNHGVGHLQRWTYDCEDAESILREIYPDIKDAAKEQGATSIWLLHRPEEKMIGLQLSFPKSERDDYDSGREALASVTKQSSLGELLPDVLKARLDYDRTSMVLALWLPLTKVSEGVHVECPNFPGLAEAHHAEAHHAE
ncbi:hypothetical protein ACJ41O_001542 [Fusarium nematophilum]